MKILLTAPPRYIMLSKWNDYNANLERSRKESLPSLAIYQLASVLMENNYEVDVLDPLMNDIATNKADDIRIDSPLFELSLRFPEIERAIRGVDAIGISVTSLDWFLARLMIKRLKAVDPTLPIIMGGVHAALADEYMLRSSSVDYVVRKEGEKTLPELLNAIENDGDLKDVMGISYNSDGRIILNKDRPPLTITEMEGLPLPAFDLMPSNFYGKISLESSRGCKSGCSFCSIPFKKSWRGISPKAAYRRVEHALEYTKKLYGDQRDIYIIDDSFSADPRRAEEILKCLQELNFGKVRIGFEGRVNEIVNSNIVRLSKKIPTCAIQVGVECGYDEGLKRIKKGITTQMVEKCAFLAKEHEVSMSFAFIIGFPWESVDDCLKTIEFSYHIVSNYGGFAFINWFHLVPGSEIWEGRKSFGIDVDLDCYDNLYLESKKPRMNVMRGLNEEDFSRIYCEIDRYNLQLLLTTNIKGSMEKIQPFFEILRVFWVDGNLRAIRSR